MPSLPRLLVPTCVTLGNAACGFGALLLLGGSIAPALAPTPEARLALAAGLVFAGWAFDMLDGTVAKLVGAASGFGAQLDSLCDAVTFGVVPSLLIVAAGGGHLPAIAAGLAYLLAVLVRLARFNQEAAQAPDDHLYFAGLSSPAAAMAVAAVALSADRLARALPEGAFPLALAALAAALAALMVSRVRYPDLPKHYTRRLRPWWRLLPAAAALVFLPLPVALLLLTLAYVAGGLAGALGGRLAGAGKAAR